MGIESFDRITTKTNTAKYQLLLIIQFGTRIMHSLNDFDIWHFSMTKKKKASMLSTE